MVGAAVLGFPLAVVLAWTYDVTSSGIVKTPEELGPEAGSSEGRKRGWLVAVVGGVVVALALRMLRM